MKLKLKENTVYPGGDRDSVNKLKKDPAFRKLNASTQKELESNLQKGKDVTIAEDLVTDSLGESLAVGDIVEIQGKKFSIQEGENGACIATMEGRCLMDVANSESRKLVENSVKIKNESYEPSSPSEPVLSVGHVDDEAGMLKQTVYDIVKYGADLYKMLERYESLNMHVDFPHWWQSKVVKARDYISMTTHYLEYETNEREIQSQIHNLDV